jgi:PHD/YefM family antitoxin component YafN of YafNO toxin-antitoxin module
MNTVSQFRSILRRAGLRVEAPKRFVAPTGTAAQVVIEENEEWVMQMIEAVEDLSILGRTPTRLYVGITSEISKAVSA